MRITALDVSRDGRYLASHGDWAVVWELSSEFAESVPVAQGKGSDSSWNVAIAPDGSHFVASGDNVAFFGRDGSYLSAGPPDIAALGCLSPDWSFSPDGTIVAGNHYGEIVQIWSASGVAPVRGLVTKNCGGGVAFSRDGRWLATANLALFETATWRNVWDHSPASLPGGLSSESAVELSPDARELVVSRCPDSIETCASERYDTSDGSSLGAVPALSGDRVRYSPEGHWMVSQHRALHLPSGSVLEYAPSAPVAAFTPGGDIIAGGSDGSLVRYCRAGD
jgi:hypothetical protein